MARLRPNKSGLRRVNGTGEIADVAELADAFASKANEVNPHAGSTPAVGIMYIGSLVRRSSKNGGGTPTSGIRFAAVVELADTYV